MTTTQSQALIPALSTLLLESSGVDAGGDHADESFLSLGLDSLFLTQFSVLVSKRYGVSLSFRQLVSELGSLSRLAAFLAERAGVPVATDAPRSNRTVQVDAPPAAAGPPPRRDEAGAFDAAAAPEALVALFLRQIDLMQGQLRALAAIDAPDAVAAAALAPPTDAPDAPHASCATQATQASQPPQPPQPPLRDAEDRGRPEVPSIRPVPLALDAARPPVEGARLGRDAAGRPAWFVPSRERPGKYVKLD